MFAGTSSGIFKSTDAGVTWGQTSAGISSVDIEVLAGDPVSPATIYAGGNNGLFKSLDGRTTTCLLSSPGKRDLGTVVGPDLQADVSVLQVRLRQDLLHNVPC